MLKKLVGLLAVATLCVLVSLPASAGENRFLGTITSTGSSVNNLTTATTFSIPQGIKVTVYCDAAARVLVDSMTTAATGASKGVPVAATTLFPTSVTRAVTGVAQVDGGSYPYVSATIAVISVSGTANCDVWQRLGND